MPIGLDPEATADIVLAADREKPEATRPSFQFYFLTVSKLRRFQEARARAADASAKPSKEEYDHLRNRALSMAMEGWRNVATRDPDIAKAFGVDPAASPSPWPLPFKPEMADELLTMDEQWELLDEFPSAIRATEHEKKASPSSSIVGTPTKDSAATAGEGSASTSPRPLNPS